MINITVVSETNRSIELVPLNTFISQNHTFSNNLITNISYNNYIVKLSDINSNFSSNTFSFVKDRMINDVVLFTILVIILICIFVFIGYLKKL